MILGLLGIVSILSYDTIILVIYHIVLLTFIIIYPFREAAKVYIKDYKKNLKYSVGVNIYFALIRL